MNKFDKVAESYSPKVIQALYARMMERNLMLSELNASVSFLCNGCKYYWYEKELKNGHCPNCGEKVL